MKTIKTRLLLLSDTHTNPPSPQTNQNTPYRHPLPEATILLHAGDITKVGLPTEHALMLSMLKSARAELKLVIAGNHDITLDEEYYARIGWKRHRFRMGYTAALSPPPPPSSSSSSSHGHEKEKEEEGDVASKEEKDMVSDVKAMYTSAEAYACGIRYLDREGTHEFRLSNGALFRVYASPYTPEFCGWAFAYPRAVDRFNPPLDATTTTTIRNPDAGVVEGGDGGYIPDFPGVDVVLTHGPPFGILDEVEVGGGSGKRKENAGCEHLYRGVERARPLLHVFGHIHEGYGARRVKWDEEGGKRSRDVQWDKETALEERCVYVDVSEESGDPVRRGEETLFVNASVVTVDYQPLNAPWVVDLDLPAA